MALNGNVYHTPNHRSQSRPNTTTPEQRLRAIQMEAQSFGGSTISRSSAAATAAAAAVNAQVDAATQADLVGYESEDERMGRRGRSKRCATPYSKGDIREQYCITKKQVQVLENNTSSALFGCLSKHHDSNCHTKHSILTKCVDRAPSDENLHESSNRPLPRRPVEDLERAYLRRRPKSVCAPDPRRYAWIPEDEEPTRMEMGRSVGHELEIGYLHDYPVAVSSEHLSANCPAHYLPPPPPPPSGAARAKHVSFARSYTLTSFDDAMMEMRRTPPSSFKSQERLILSTAPGKRLGPHLYQTYEQRTSKKPPMKTQATQTGIIGKEPPNYLSLSPRTVHRGAQTNGQLQNGRRLMKSFSEAGGSHFGMESADADKREHDALTRTQSEEPRSPYMVHPTLPWPEGRGQRQVPRGCSQSGTAMQGDRPGKVYKEIFIDFEPADLGGRSCQSYPHSEGEYMSHYVEEDVLEPVVDRVDGVKVSLSSYSSVHEGERPPSESDQHVRLGPQQDSVDEEFHENFLYNAMFHKQKSTESEPGKEAVERSGESSPECVGDRGATIAAPTNNLTVSRRISPFASSDSLTTDHRADVSDGIWNESQSTVLQAESDNGTISRSSGRKHMLLLQHQQRSSIDTDALDDDISQSQLCISPPQKNPKVPCVTIATVHHYEQHAENKQMKSLPKLSPGDRRRKIMRNQDKDIELQPPVPQQRRDSGRVTDISETSTTEDYATAHDNSCEDSIKHAQEGKPDSKAGSSFESATSLPGNAREDIPSASPPIKEEIIVEGLKKAEEKEETVSLGESSSSGSYSIASCQKDPREWTDQERSSAKKGFKLDLSDQSVEQDIEEGNGLSGRPKPSASPKRGKTKTATRKSQQGQSKKWATKEEDIVPSMVRSPAMPEGFRAEEWAPPQRTTPSHTPEETFPLPKIEAEVSSDESSCENKYTGIDDTISGHSPRRQRKRGGGRGRRGADTKIRRPLMPTQPSHPPPTAQQALSPSNYCPSPAHSPRASPRKHAKGTKHIEHKKHEGDPGCHLKAISAESLRSVSPGSDSVFYNEAENHYLCHQCGREVDTEPAASAAATTASTASPKQEPIADIVQPPPRFADSPESSQSRAQRIFKKQEKRFRSEERSGERRRHTRPRTDLRAKSEERGKERKKTRERLRPHAHSTDASMELLRGADSSPSISDPFTEDDQRVYADVFKKASWINIVEEAHKVLNPNEESKKHRIEMKDDSSAELSPTEKEFNKRFQAATHRMVHRKSSIDMFRRLQDKTFECDLKVVVRRQSGEFGFRIHGSRPVVVSAIEPDTPAETSGLHVGDIVLSVNGISVLEASHSDVVKLAHSGSDTLELEVARTLTALTATAGYPQQAVHSGFLHKMGVDRSWHRRWFVLRPDNCLYYYHSKAERQPLGAILLLNYTFSLHNETDRLHSFSISKLGAKSLELSADSAEELSKWKGALETAMAAVVSRQGEWFEMSCKLLQQPASSLMQPDCFGHLTQLEDKWRRRYCVLKDAALVIYADSSAERAMAVACLQGYRVQSTGTSTKRFSFEIVPPESKQKNFYFYTDTEMDKKRWIAALEFSIDRWMKVA